MAERMGRQTPTKSAVLPYERSKGEQAATLYELSGRTAMPWQRALLRDIMARTEDGLWTHTRFGYAVPRRNGKTEVVYAREMWGLLAGEQILHTAHRTKTTHASWEKLYELLKAAGVPVAHTYRARGSEHIYLPNGGRIEYRTRTAKGGLGEGFDLLVVDEAQEYQDDQETALKYIITASKNPQTILLGTPPTQVSSGTVFTRYRDEAMAGAAPDAGWAEWSVDRERDPYDREAWYTANPSLGVLLTERNIASEITAETLDFNIQRLGLWVRYEVKSEISEAEWAGLRLTSKPKLGGKLCAGIKFGKDGTNVSLSVAARTDDGRIFVEAVDKRPTRDGTGWLLEFLQKAGPARTVIDGAGGQQILQHQMKAMKLHPEPVLPTVKEIITANAAFQQALTDRSICHMGQPGLTAAVCNCEKRPIGSNGGFGYRSLREEVDIAVMDSMILAMWGCSNIRDAKQTITY